TDSTVLIQGETGTGKELIARAIHHGGPRRGGPFLTVNCAALSAGLLESELFGHVKGAFTGAEHDREGRFQLADGGTILLDEVTEIDEPLQAKLLRVLQESEFEPVGSSESIRVDVRVIATTNRDIAEAVREGDFREDLFFRLNVLPVVAAPLRDRREDIPVLVKHFCTRQSRRMGVPEKSFDAAAMRALAEYRWPGNVRELENLVERLYVLVPETTVSAEAVAPYLGGSSGGGPVRSGEIEPGFTSIEEAERVLIEATLERFDGHRQKTAEALGIGVRTLGMKLKQWGLVKKT
ncbi:MAG: sigma-54 interaction domain-containing protein, partial [Planctomycetota bacterium]